MNHLVHALGSVLVHVVGVAYRYCDTFASIQLKVLLDALVNALVKTLLNILETQCFC